MTTTTRLSDAEIEKMLELCRDWLSSDPIKVLIAQTSFLKFVLEHNEGFSGLLSEFQSLRAREAELAGSLEAIQNREGR